MRWYRGVEPRILGGLERGDLQDRLSAPHSILHPNLTRVVEKGEDMDPITHTKPW